MLNLIDYSPGYDLKLPYSTNQKGEMMGYDDPREEKRVTTTEETVVPSQPVEQTVEKTETVERTETFSPPSSE